MNRSRSERLAQQRLVELEQKLEQALATLKAQSERLTTLEVVVRTALVPESKAT